MEHLLEEQVVEGVVHIQAVEVVLQMEVVQVDQVVKQVQQVQQTLVVAVEVDQQVLRQAEQAVAE
jgi:hypothetical protein